MRDVLKCDELFDCKDAVNRAFHFAKKASTGEDKHGPDFLEFREFRLFLQTLRENFEFYQAFARSVAEIHSSSICHLKDSLLYGSCFLVTMLSKIYFDN